MAAVFTHIRNACCSPKGIYRVIRNLRREYALCAFQTGTNASTSFRFGAPIRDEVEMDRFAILKTPRFEGDQEVTTLGSIQINAAKGADSAPFSFWQPP